MTQQRIEKQWRIRRRMAIIAYVCGLFIYPVAFIKWPELKELSMAYYSLITVVLGAYYGFATYHDIKETNQNE